jgi:hypothetical protein
LLRTKDANKKKALKVKGKMTFYFTKDSLSVMTDNKIESK